MRGAAAVLAALGGRFGWRWWAPAASWLVVAAVTRIWFLMPIHGLATVSTAAAGVFVLLTVAQVGLIWRSSGFALTLGHRRSGVYLVAVAATCGLPLLVGALIRVAERVEPLLLGAGGVRVFSLGAGVRIESLTLLLGAVVAVIAISGMRWGWRGTPLTLVVTFALMGLVSSLLGEGNAVVPGPPDWRLLVVAAVALLAVWPLYRKVPA